jgi:hypothetical protein
MVFIVLLIHFIFVPIHRFLILSTFAAASTAAAMSIGIGSIGDLLTQMQSFSFQKPAEQLNLGHTHLQMFSSQT